MDMRTPSLVVVLSFLVVPALAGGPAADVAAQTADEVVEKHLAALGGREALGKLTSRRSTGTVTIATTGGNLSGPIEVSVKAPNKVRVFMQLDLSAMGIADKMTVEQKFDGTAGRALNSMQGDFDITGNQLDNLRNNVFPTSLLNYKAAGTTLELQPKTQLAGKDVIVLVATPKAGSAVRMFLDAATHLLVRTRVYVNSPQMGEFDQIAEFSDYRPMDGVNVPFQIVNSNPSQTGTITLTKVEHNVPMDDAIFKATAPVAAASPARR
jgi:outer membrane lipoprotein-sorting protein